jgi:hypothetical protein
MIRIKTDFTSDFGRSKPDLPTTDTDRNPFTATSRPYTISRLCFLVDTMRFCSRDAVDAVAELA